MLSKPQEGKIYYLAKSFRNERGISTKKNLSCLGTLEEIRQRDKAIKAHFAICFIALFLYRVLENRIGDDFTTVQILSGLRDMNALQTPSDGFIQTFKHTPFTDRILKSAVFILTQKL